LAKAHLRLADGKPIALDEDGTLALSRGTSQGLDVLSLGAPEQDCLDTDDAVRYEALRA
jgi:hypothetical protein